MSSEGPENGEKADLVRRLRKAAQGGRLGLLFEEAADAIEALAEQVEAKDA